MTTSLHDLLATARTLLASLPPDGTGAEQAIATLAPTARALRVLVADGFEATSDGRRSDAVRELVQQCALTAPGWPPPSPVSVPSGHLPAIVGVAADVASQLSKDLGRNARWCAAVEFSDLARHAATAARHVTAYRQIRPLAAVQTLAGRIEQIAAAHPPDPLRLSGLDRPVTNPHLPCGPLGPRLAGEAAARLVADIYATRGAGLRAVEARAAATVCEAAANTLQDFAVALSQPRRPNVVSGVVHHWRSVELALRPLVDRFRPTATSPLIAHSTLLHRCLSDGAPPRRTESGQSADPAEFADLADYATHARMIANQLPAIAAALRGGLIYAAFAGRYTARVRHLPPTTARLRAAGQNRIITIAASDLKPATDALRQAEACSTRLAARLAESAGLVGEQPQPYLATTFTAQSGNANRLVM